MPMIVITMFIYPPNTPSISDLTVRLCRGEMDYPAIVTINNASWSLNDRLDVDTLEDCRASFAAIAHLNLTRDVLIAEISGQPIAYAVVAHGDGTDAQGQSERWFDVEATVTPQWRRRKVGRALHGWLESRATEILTDLPAVDRTYLTSTTRDKNTGRAILLQQFGFEPTRFWFGMEQSLAEAKAEHPLPDNLEVRAVRAEHFRKILTAHQDAFRERPDNQAQPTDAELAEFGSSAIWQMKQYKLWQVAWDGDEVAGMVLNNIDLKGNQQLGLNRGFTDPICVGHKWRRRGVAKALISRSLNVLRQAGVKTAFLGVDTQNPHGALRLYEAMGFVKVKSGTTYQKDI